MYFFSGRTNKRGGGLNLSEPLWKKNQKGRKEKSMNNQCLEEGPKFPKWLGY